MTSDEIYVEQMFKNWKNRKDELRKKLPSIYQNTNDKDIKDLISMLVESEYVEAIHVDNERRKNGLVPCYADKYKKENKDIFDLLGV